MTRNRITLLAFAACLSVLVLLLWAKRPARRDAPDGVTGPQAVSNLASRVRTQPPPQAPRASPAPAPGAPSAAAPAAAPVLTEAHLLPLRQAFVPPRFGQDPRQPRERQTLLSNRLLITPEARNIPSAASGRQTPSARNTTPFIVQFAAPVSQASRQALTEIGAAVRGFFPNQALLAEFTPAALGRLAALDAVQAATEYLPTDKVQPFLASLSASFPAESAVPVTIQTFAPEDAAHVAETVRAAGGTVSEVSASSPRWGLVQATLPLRAVATLAARGDVQWIEERPPVTTQNDRAVLSPRLNLSNVWHTLSLTGRGQIIGHADTGLDTGVTNTLHADLRTNLLALIARGRAGNASDPNGHGTHTAGSILGSGAASAGQFRGTAWEARLVHQSVLDAYGYLSGIPADLYELFAETYAYGARVHSDSWGSSTYGAYTVTCQAADLFAWENPDHLAVFSAGNSGRDGDADGVVDLGSVSSPAAAKNVLSVGASESDRPAGSGGYTSYRYSVFADYSPTYLRWFPTSPIANDYISYSYSAATPPYRQGMAAFSSRGPTEDGRIKPDVVAPGTDVISCRSSVGGSGWGVYNSNTNYCFNGGTSMAAPLMAGAAALMRQFAIERVGITNPSAALVKAMLIGGARTLTPGQYGTGAAREIPAVSPNSVEGWGQPDLSAALCPTNLGVCLLDRIGPSEAGATNTFSLTVTASNTPLDVALVWIDYPATAGAAVTRVNDLDLVVTGPDGSLTWPNAGTGPDPLNTVETVRFPAAQAGTYQIRVSAAALPYAGGAAALYARGALAPTLRHTPIPAQIAGVPPEPVTFLVQPASLAPSVSARLFWAAGTATAPTGDWRSSEATWVTNALLSAPLPALPPAVTVHYYLEAGSGPGAVRLPQEAPAQTFSFYVDETVELLVEGSPARIAVVSPPYGLSARIKRVPFEAAAPSSAFSSDGVRNTCIGWSGTGDVPATGSANRVLLELAQASSLTWLWQTEFALTNRLRLADADYDVGETVSWHPAGSQASTATAPELIRAGSSLYAFCGWQVDGSRWPDATSAARNPATGIVMHVPRLAQGDYLPFWQDTDGDQLGDWWELRYFGNPTDSPASALEDLDGDGFVELQEYLDNSDPRDAASRPRPPTITVLPLAPFQTQHPPWSVQAEVDDNLAVEQVFLVWREKGDAAWQTNVMAAASNALYEAALNPPSHGAKRVDYFVLATDLLGYYQPAFAATSATYSVIGDYDAPWMSVTPDTFGLLELTDPATNLALTVSNLAGPDLLWTARVAVAQTTFAASDAAWSHSGANDVWCVTTNRTWNGDAVWYCGNPATRQYPNSCHAKLNTPTFRVGAGGCLLWRQWFRAERETETHFWDGGTVSLSIDGGATFATLTPTAGYPYRITPNPASPFPSDQPCLAGDGEGWQTLMVDLSAYAGQDAIVRFEFGSDEYTVDEGWYLAGVTPLALDAPPAWLTPLHAWGGLLPARWSASPSLLADPAPLARDEEAVACVRVEGSDAAHRPILPLTVRRGHLLTAAANGPGAAAADRTFLFRGSPSTVTFTADAGAYLYAVTVNGVPLQGAFTMDTTTLSLTFTNRYEDLEVQGWFALRTWSLLVVSDFGTATPAAGTHTFAHGTRVNASVTTPLAFGGGFSQYACSGWLLSGHSPKIGFEPSLSFELTNDAILVWQWQTNHWLNALAGANGTVTPTGGWYAAGSSAALTAHPASYHHLVTWIGDTDGGLADGTAYALPMTRPRNVVAMFAANYTPTHNVPEPWLASFGWTNNFDEAAESDSDADGMATWQEWQADTDPTNTLSLLALTGLSLSNGAVRVRWIGGTGRRQVLTESAAPGGPWQPVFTNLPPTPVTNLLHLPAPRPSAFYRIQAHP